MYFSNETSKRIDLELTSAKHVEQHAQYTESNSAHKLFTDVTKRSRMTMEDFKASSELHPDYVKEAWQSFK